MSFPYALNAGNNYLYFRMITATGQSDANDFASFSWVYRKVPNLNLP